jgi:hypothetical protein
MPLLLTHKIGMFGQVVYGASQAWAVTTSDIPGSIPGVGNGPWQIFRHWVGSLATTTFDVNVCGIVAGSGGQWALGVAKHVKRFLFFPFLFQNTLPDSWLQPQLCCLLFTTIAQRLLPEPWTSLTPTFHLPALSLF